MITNSFNDKIDVKGKKIIIYGAGRYGEIAFRGLEFLGYKPDLFADRALFGSKFLNISVIAPEEIEKQKPCIVLVAVYNAFKDAVEFLKKNNISEYYDISELLTLEFDRSVLSEYALDEISNSQKYINMISDLDYNKLNINHIEICVTECCTLKCRDCANLMQYYKKPENINVSEIIRYFDKLVCTIDTINEMRILGGEPFLNRDIDKLIGHYLSNPKIKLISVYTNSTIIPKDDILNALKFEKVCVHLSDYGRVSKNLSKLIELLEKNKIRYNVHKYNEWFDVGDLKKYNYTNIESVSILFRDCIIANCNTFYRGKLYICPRSAHGERLGVFKNKPFEYVDFTDNNLTSEVLREKVSNLLHNISYLTACFYCKGCSNYSNKVIPAIQNN